MTKLNLVYNVVTSVSIIKLFFRNEEVFFKYKRFMNITCVDHKKSGGLL